MSGKKTVKIIVLTVVLALVAGMWVYKNYSDGIKGFLGNDQAQNGGREPDQSADGGDGMALTRVDLDALKAEGLPIMLQFVTDSCPSCVKMKPTVTQAYEDYKGQVLIRVMNVSKYSEGVENFPVEVVPTQFFFDREGNPYEPSDSEAMRMILYSRKDGGEHVYTACQGLMTREELDAVFKELGAGL